MAVPERGQAQTGLHTCTSVTTTTNQAGCGTPSGATGSRPAPAWEREHGLAAERDADDDGVPPHWLESDEQDEGGDVEDNAAVSAAVVAALGVRLVEVEGLPGTIALVEDQGVALLPAGLSEDERAAALDCLVQEVAAHGVDRECS